MERKGVITFKGNPLTLLGNPLKVGDKAPDFLVLDNNLNQKSLKDFSGKIKIVSVTPSLDTPVCDMQARRFNSEARKLSDNVIILNISMDLPFALSRFCTTAGIDRVITLSDHKDTNFGSAYGVLIKELRLLARAVFVIDKDDVIKYIELVPEITEQPKYEKILEVVKSLIH